MDQEYEGQETEEAEDNAPRLSKPYLDMIHDAERAFQSYQSRCDAIDARYASLDKMADAVGDREFQIFWANLEVLKPTIYQRPPQPVVMPRHKDGGELARKASEMLERVLSFVVEDDDLHETLTLVRDDLAMSARGVAWVLDDGRTIHVDRCDFVHDPARKWQEVGWVARRAYLTREEGVERFGDIFKTAKCDFVKGKDDGNGNDYRPTAKKAQVWELWHRAEQRVVWVTEGVAEVLDEQPPLIDVRGFFPCPRPAYGTLERRKLIPVPDFIYYRDQVDEINELTARIADLAESLRLKGFYASGTSEVGEAIEAAMKATDNKAILVPVSSFAALGGGALKDSIVWLPVREVAEVITACVQLRQQLIQDVYEITGLSDIMRGSTEASETATAQNLKAQYGSVRVRERQAEMVRIARDVLRIKAEVFAEMYSAADLAVMAQMEFPTAADVQAMQMQAQQAAMMAQQQGQPAPPMPDPSKIVTIEQVGALLKDERVRPFVLDVESDSTIAPNEEAEKAARIEFVTAVGGFIQQAGAMVQQQPQTAPFVGEMLKFTAGAFRAGRELGGVIDEFVDQIKQVAATAGQQQGPTPEQMKAQADAEARKAELQLKAQEMQAKAQVQQAELQLKAQEMAAEVEAKRTELQLKAQELALKQSEAQAQALARQSDAEFRAQELASRERADLTAKGLPEGYNFADHQAQMTALAERMAAGEAQTADALTAMGEALSRVMDAVTAPRKLLRGPDGAVQGVEIMAAQPMKREVARDQAGNISGVDRLN